ncbi:Scr1 family TA system antitoxin-like transcriptional regulator [Streptomyces sp. NPDC048438]|uniref:Scr1 family TA system antitoxin-like transcriptional regulator n=1 Tax=Streptomyces sp. NPDC048438 TaxID=3365551 RepID=UPI0037167F38
MPVGLADVQLMPTERTEHCGLAGPFTLIEKHDGRRMAYVEVQRDSRLHTDWAVVRDVEEQYGIRL